MRLHVVREGVGEPVVLLHGFPECWYSWRHQIAPLAEAGYSVYAPDLRGFNLSDRPTGVCAYAIEHLVEDVAGLVRASGHTSAHIVGHDWGGLLAWFFAALRPTLTATLTILNAPHPTIYGRQLWRSFQWWKSAYVPVFMTPRLAETLLTTGHYYLFRHMFLWGAANQSAFTSADIDTYVQAASRPGALTAGLNYYRANAKLGFAATRLPHIEAPTLVIWGERDPALGVSLLSGLGEVVGNLHIERLSGVGHWVQNEASEQVTTLLISHLRAQSRRAT